MILEWEHGMKNLVLGVTLKTEKHICLVAWFLLILFCIHHLWMAKRCPPQPRGDITSVNNEAPGNVLALALGGKKQT